MSLLPPPSATLLTEPPRGAGAPTIELPPLPDLSLAAPPRSPDLPAVAMPMPSGTPLADPSELRASTADDLATGPEALAVDPSPVSSVWLEAEPSTVDRDIAELMAAPLLRREQSADQDTEHAHEEDRLAVEQARHAAEAEWHAAEAEWHAFEAEWDAVERKRPAVEDWHVVEPPELAPPAGSRSDSAVVAGPPDVAEDPQEQALEQSRGTRRRAIQLVGVLSLLGIAVAAWFVIPAVADRATGDDDPIDTGTAGGSAVAGESSDAADDSAADAGDGEPESAEISTAVDGVVPVAADVDDVWLLDRGDGRYDWGAVVVSTADDVRNDLDVVATLLDADGKAVHVEEFRIVELGPGGSGAAGGVFEAGGVGPVRIELVATVAASDPEASSGGSDQADDTTPGNIEYRATDLRRIPSGQVDRDDRLLGSIEVGPFPFDDAPESNDGRATVVRVAALWRDEEGAVVAAFLDEIEPPAGSSTLDFSLGLSRAVVPPGLPDDVVVSIGT